MTSQEKQNVRKAAQLLSRTVAISLRRYDDTTETSDLADFIEKIDLWFSVSNSFSPFAKEDYKKSYNGNEMQRKALNDMRELMENSIALGKSSLQTFQKLFKHKLHFICNTKSGLPKIFKCRQWRI